MVNQSILSVASEILLFYTLLLVKTDPRKGRKLEPLTGTRREYGELVNSVLMFVFALGIHTVHRDNYIVAVDSGSRSRGIENRHVG